MTQALLKAVDAATKNKRITLASIILVGLSSLPALATLTLSQNPLFLAGSVQPMVMLDISKDHQLWKKAYNDYSDLDGDGQLDITYKHSVNYYGYFDPGKCYTYDSTDQRYEPASVSATKYCSGQWSGNFLNWASMSRMDAVRKLLYGGHRSTDSSADTVLERAYVPPDAHAWTKYYDGSDLAQLTPYTPTTTSTTSSTSQAITNTGANTVSYVFTVGSTTGFVENNYVLADAGSGNFLKGQITAIAGSNITLSVANANYGESDTSAHSSWTLSNLSTRGLTVCNVTPGSTTAPQNWSHTNTNAPQIRFAAGNHSLWNANESWQCLWNGEQAVSNANNFAHSGIPASSSNPSLVTGTGLGNFVARVQVCVPSLLGTEKCKRYPSGNYKPIGLLQVYGDTDQIRFGLMTGSYTKNISGGVLRKNVGAFTDELNASTDGTFTATVGIAKTLDRLRIYGFFYGSANGYSNDGAFSDVSITTGAASNCAYRVTSLVENSCTASWGNPMAELYYESLRYFANNGSYSPLYNYTDSGSKDAALNLPQPPWTQPVSQTNYCTPLNTLVFNTSVSTDDRDLKDTAMTNIGSGSTAGVLTDAVGSGEGISGNYFIGANGTTSTGRCDAKTVSGLGSLYGICPEGPTLEGSYLIAGLAHRARTNKIRSDLTVPASDAKSLKVTTYGVQLATNVPRVAIALTGETTPRVILQPAYWMYDAYRSGGGALVDLKIVSQTATSTTATGTLFVIYETSEAGADHDQDAWGVIRYCLTTVANGCGTGSVANTISVTTDIVAESAGSQQGSGYTISGTTQDGAHFHSGTDGFNYTDPTGVLGCTGCVVGNAATTVTYTLGSTTAGILKDPLYYAAKWGGFNELDATAGPNLTAEWDSLRADGTSGSDGLPDNYFLVSNPLGLETALNAAFLKILRDSSASAVATNSSTLDTGIRIYQGRFSNVLWSGQLLSYQLSPTTGAVLSAATAPPAWDTAETPYPEWDAGQKIKAQASASTDARVILTKGSAGTGAAFQYANLSSSQAAALNQDRLLQQDNCGPERVAWLRGHSVNEGSGALTCATAPASGVPTPQKFRTRAVSILGDIINSSPNYVGPPAAGYSDVDHAGYSAFRTSYKDRKPVVYVGANDGMLHGFDVSLLPVDTDATVDSDGNGVLNDDANDYTSANTSGNEVLAYIPSVVYPNLSKLTASSYSNEHQYSVDDSPFVGDADLDSTSTNNWRTVLVGSMGAGGKGYYALDVTNPTGFTEANAANILLWEFDETDMGFAFNRPPIYRETNQAKQIVKLANGKWAAIVGNGYNSVDGKAVLYILFIQDGMDGTWSSGDYVKIVADATTGTVNGLSTPVPFDSNADSFADTVYAGDLKGRVWKFLIGPNSSDTSVTSDPATWKVAFSGSPLFTATDSAGLAQPITWPPEVTSHPISGQLVLIGTGKYLDSTTDNTNTDTQTFYGLWDKHDVAATRIGARAAELLQQTVSLSGGFRVPSTNPISWRTVASGSPANCTPSCSPTHLGWYMDLPTSKEKTTGIPKLDGNAIFFNTLIPSTAQCDAGGTGWLMALDYLTGGKLIYQIFDTNDDDEINSDDTLVGGYQIGAAIGGTTIIRGPVGTQVGVGVASLTTGGITTPKFKLPGGGSGSGRVGWREIIQ